MEGTVLIILLVISEHMSNANSVFPVKDGPVIRGEEKKKEHRCRKGDLGHGRNSASFIVW